MITNPGPSLFILLLIVFLCFSPWIVVKLEAWEKRRQIAKEEQWNASLEAWERFRKEALAMFPDRCGNCKGPITWDEHYQEWTHIDNEGPYCA